MRSDRNRVPVLMGLVLAGLSVAAASGDEPAERAEAAEFPTFTQHEIGKWGSGLGGTALVDIDRDGDLDFTSATKGGSISWWENRGPDDWVRHDLHAKNTSEVGGTAYDVDGDGWVDYVAGGSWYRNTGKPTNEPFVQHRFKGFAAHDSAHGDIDGDGDTDVVHMQRKQLAWFEAPADPTQQWTRHDFGEGVHAGLGLGDLDGDGDLDVVRADRWYENDGAGGGWKAHPMKHGLGDNTVTAVGDLDGDGDQDLALAKHDADRIVWMENTDGKGGFVERPLWDGLDTCHSVVIADFDKDGRNDIYAGDTGNKGGHAYVWHNRGGGRFGRRVIAEQTVGHNTVAADIDGDGDLDLCSKPWRGNGKFNGLHVFLRNELNPEPDPE